MFLHSTFSDKLRGNENVDQHLNSPMSSLALVRNSVDGLIPNVIDFAPTLPTKTQKRINKKVRNEGNEDVNKLASCCVGIPTQVYGKGADFRCGICKKNMSWYCSKCKS